MTSEGYSAESLSALLEASAVRFPNSTAVVDPDGSVVTYTELNAQADRLAACLAANGVKRGDRVGMIVPKSASAVAALFGIMKAGAASCPRTTVPRENAIRPSCGTAR